MDSQKLTQRMFGFLEKVDNYLIADIKTMLAMEDKQNGGLGFTCLQDILAGMELMGRFLTSEGNTPSEKGGKAFYRFWTELSQDTPIYNSLSLRKIFRNAIRNGTAHYFMVKYGIQVHLHKGVHLGFSTSNNLHITCSTLFEDFFKTYTRLVSDIKIDPQHFVSNFQCLIDDAINVSNINLLNDYYNEVAQIDPARICTSYIGSSASIPYSYDELDINVMTSGASTLLPDFLIPSGDTFIPAVDLDIKIDSISNGKNRKK